MKYGIAIFPSKQLQDIANSYRKRYDPKYALIPPHLTLKEAFEATEEELKDMIPEIRKIAQESEPFTLNCYKVSSFHPANNTIYFGVEKDEKLMNLQSMLNTGILERETRYNFIPHITIGQNLSDDEHSDVLGRLKMKSISHEEKIDRFQLLYQLENEQWTVHETFHLGKERIEA